MKLTDPTWGIETESNPRVIDKIRERIRIFTCEYGDRSGILILGYMTFIVLRAEIDQWRSDIGPLLGRINYSDPDLEFEGFKIVVDFDTKDKITCSFNDPLKTALLAETKSRSQG